LGGLIDVEQRFIPGRPRRLTLAIVTVVLYLFVFLYSYPEWGLGHQHRWGNFVSQTNLLRRGLHPPLQRLGQPKAGFHAFRRFRTTWLRKNRTPEHLIRFWLGHADETVTDGYSKLREDVEYRKEVAAEVGLGFEISGQKPVVVPNVPRFAVSRVEQNVA
jgi:integrase